MIAIFAICAFFGNFCNHRNHAWDGGTIKLYLPAEERINSQAIVAIITIFVIIAIIAISTGMGAPYCTHINPQAIIFMYAGHYLYAGYYLYAGRRMQEHT